MGFSTRQIVIFYYALSASFGVLGISGAEPRLKLLALLLLMLLVAAVIVYISRRAAACGE